MGWDGSLCGVKVDLCKKQPCFAGVNCTNVYTEPAKAECAPCPTGYEGDGRACSGISKSYLFIPIYLFIIIRVVRFF